MTYYGKPHDAFVSTRALTCAGLQSHKEHYFLLEMCYVVNLVLALYVWVLPNNPWLWKVLSYMRPLQACTA